jgi:hypothetical protein
MFVVMVFDAHEKAFQFFKGSCQRGIYDNMRTAVDAVFVGKERKFNRRFLRLMDHQPHCPPVYATIQAVEQLMPGQARLPEPDKSAAF